MAYDFGTPFFRKLHLPNNLHVLGTMNRADRSIAILDVAARRRFAFLSLWPSLKVVEEHGCELSQKAFQELVSTFIEHAADETLPLVPGHSYFLGRDEERARTNLRTSLVPLLTEYLAQGYVSGFAEPIRAYLQWLESLCSPSNLPSSRRWAHAGADNKTDARHLPGAPGSHARHEPELRDDRHLKGAIRFTIEKQLRSLETQHEVGAFIHRLIALAESLLRKVDAFPSRRPEKPDVETWLRRPMRTDSFIEGLQAIDWTVEERGLAGLSDLEGIPWTMPMEHFFEAWVETVMRSIARQMGGRFKAGRRREAVFPLAWDPPYLGSQRSLIPDMILELEGTSFIVDAKYKRHWEELEHGAWHEQNTELRERHRVDLLQVLAYANLASTTNIVCCLVYPCSHYLR